MSIIEYKEYEALPEGTYLLEVTGVSEKVAQTGQGKGSTYLQWVMDVAEEGEFEGQRLFVNTSQTLSEKSKLYKLLKACGLGELGEGDKIDTEDFVSQLFYGKVIIKTSDNKEFNDIETYFSVAEFKAMLEKASKGRRSNPDKSTSENLSTVKPDVVKPDVVKPGVTKPNKVKPGRKGDNLSFPGEKIEETPPTSDTEETDKFPE